MRTLFSTRGTNPKNSFRTWQEVAAERFVPTELTKIGEGAFDGTLEVADLGSMLITRSTFDASRTEVTPGTIRRHNKQGTLAVTIRLAGTTANVQNDREAFQRAGDIMVLDSTRPAILSSSANSQSLLIELPRERLESMLGPASLYAALTIEAAQASASLVTTFFTELVRVHENLDPDTAARMASIGTDLIVASVAERLAREVPKPLHGAVVLQRAKAYVENNLGDPRLDPPLLAAAVGVSLRRLHELFHEHGQHVSDWIWQRRLHAASRRLGDGGHRHVPIGTIAYGCGFTSQGHFSRRFKDRFGLTPSEYREAAARKDRGTPWA